MPLAEIGTCPVTIPPCPIYCGLMMLPGALKSRPCSMIALLWDCHAINNDSIVVAQVPAEQHASGFGYVAPMLSILLHD
jgi:hypothetical protein